MIYFDNSATTKPCPEALSAINEALSENWGNPSSSHFAGDAAHRELENARKIVASSLGIRRPTDGKIVFTSGGTEANCLAMLGAVRSKERPAKNGSRGTVIITDSEHASIDSPAAALEKEGFRVLKIPTLRGKLDLEWLRQNADRDVIFASIMLVNNETGAVYNVKEAAKIIKSASPGAVVHSDLVQGYLKIKNFAPKDIGVDMATVSAHKVYSAKGAGALYISRDIISAKKISPIIFGGGQEEGYRSGTESLPAIVGFSAAVKCGVSELSKRNDTMKELSSYAAGKLEKVDGVRLNLPAERAPHILNMTVFGIKSETMLNFLSGRGICVSKSSACSTHSKSLSRALISFGLAESEVDSSLRLSFSHGNTKDEIDIFIQALEEGILRLAKIK